jgi:hypothetical protein
MFLFKDDDEEEEEEMRIQNPLLEVIEWDLVSIL